MDAMKRITTAAVVIFLMTGVSAQDAATPKALVPLLATDSHGRPVSGLTPSSLTITEHKVPVTAVSLLQGSDLPLELGLIIDTSSSERDGSFKEMMEGAKVFVNEVVRQPEDRIFFLTFAMTTEATGWLKKDQLAGISINVKMGGGTALYDAVAAACRERMGPRNWNRPTRRVLVVITDGDDNSSHVTRDQALSEALSSGVTMFTLSTRTYGMQDTRADRVLEDFARATGGQFITGLSRKDVPKAFAQIKEASEGMYYASYVPPSSNNRVHEVEIKPANKEHIEISYPKKYLWVQ